MSGPYRTMDPIPDELHNFDDAALIASLYTDVASLRKIVVYLKAADEAGIGGVNPLGLYWDVKSGWFPALVSVLEGLERRIASLETKVNLALVGKP